MNLLEYAYYIFSFLLVLFTIIPLVPHQHWFFRIFDFAKVQIMVIQIVMLLIGIIWIKSTPIHWITILTLLASIIYELYLIWPYMPWIKAPQHIPSSHASESYTILSVNVYQFNTDYQSLISLIQEVKPNIILTMESNQDWDNALLQIESDYPYQHKVPLENTYGIHLYANIPWKKATTHYKVADDIPSIEAHFKTKRGEQFVFWGIHPPPPSPTEEDTSKERDGELLAIAKHIREHKQLTIVAGDFNNVAWAKSSVLFRKTAELIDPRKGRGLISTFHAKYWLLRFPIDQLFHSTEIYIQQLKTLRNIGSDHLPLFCEFYIDTDDQDQEAVVERLEAGAMSEVNEMIAEGKAEDGDREAVATE